jgi:hypothetical protein
MTYEQWKTAVSALVEDACGVPMEWLPDWLSRDAYDDGASPQEGAELCLESSGFYESERLVEID